MSKFLKFFCKACKSPFYTAYKANRCINCGSDKIIPQGQNQNNKTQKEVDDLTDDDFLLDEIESIEEEGW